MHACCRFHCLAGHLPEPPLGPEVPIASTLPSQLSSRSRNHSARGWRPAASYGSAPAFSAVDRSPHKRATEPDPGERRAGSNCRGRLRTASGISAAHPVCRSDRNCVLGVRGFRAALAAAITGAVLGDYFFVAPLGRVTVHPEGLRSLLLLLLGAAAGGLLTPPVSLRKS
jgi:hypothetical protein